MRHAGNVDNGRKLFSDKRTRCNVCHKVAGKGGDVGVELSKIGGKFDRPHLIESLLEPSRQIVEGYRTVTALLHNGKAISGIIKQQNDQQITIADAEAKRHVVPRADIDELSVSTVSLMPEGLTKQLSQGEFTDLVAYLESLRTGVKEKMGSAVVGPISLPDGFELNTVATGLDGVTALDVLPDGRVLVCEQPGRVRVVENGKLLDEPFITLPVDSNWERGVIGVTHDPEFPRQPFVYVCWVAKEPYSHHRVSRFTMDGNVAEPGSEKVLLEGDDQSKLGGKVPAGHQGGAVHFGSDGKLYVGIGEQTAGMPAQELDTFQGKILRINPDGSIPDDNPFMDRTKGKYRAIWAYGARNPFTFAIRKSDGLMLINDVGGKFEEINVGRAGANYGWPVIEHGNEAAYQTADYDGPIHWYPQSSINGGDFSPSDNTWPKEWRGRYFFADFVHGWIHSLDPDRPSDVKTFVEGIHRPVDMQFAPDGSLYVLLRNAWVIDDKFEGDTGSLLRIRPNVRAKSTTAHSTTPQEKSPPDVPEGTVVFDANSRDESAGNLPAFKIKTPNATWYLEKSGGGLSSIVDRDGNDWLGFHPERNSGAGGEYRGFPNAVHKQNGSYFHARNAFNDPMKATVESVEPGRVAIAFQSETGHWAGRYEFFPTHCTFTVTRVPDESNYWVLYEGTPGGELNADDWWMTSEVKQPQPIGKRHEADIPAPEWMAFGDANGSRSVLLMNHTDDDFPDFHYQMHDKMTVFGFGRRNMEAFHSAAGRSVSIGLLESTSHSALDAFAKEVIEKSAEKHNVGSTNAKVLSAAVDTDDAKQQPSQNQNCPQPGDVYREYAIHNGGNIDWRVTDPRARAEGAKQFLPNPILTLDIRDLDGAIRAEAVIDRWGGHAGTKDKQIRFNENDWITLPELTTTPTGHDPERYHSQDNPVVVVPLQHLKKGANTIEGTIGENNTVKWGQWGLYSLILRIYYDPEQKAGVSKGRIVTPVSGATISEDPTIVVECDDNAEQVDLLAWYDGFDENGDGIFRDWHGSRIQVVRGEPADLRYHVGSIDPSIGERNITWKTQWVPDQAPGSIKLVTRVRDGSGLIYVTEQVTGLTLQRDGWSVKQYRATNVPEAFSVRVGQSKSCTIPVPKDANLTHATAAVLHLRTWEADDKHHKPFEYNGHQHKNRGMNHHYDYDLLPIPVEQITPGDNTFTIHSDTVHHMLEVLWPGPALTVRYRISENSK